MKIYVATKWEEKDRARAIMTVLEFAGHTITYDWTRCEQVSPDQALADYMGVIEADALVLIAEKDLNYCGALVEFGIALGWGIPVYVLGDALDERCIFMKLQHIHRGIGKLLGTVQ